MIYVKAAAGYFPSLWDSHAEDCVVVFFCLLCFGVGRSYFNAVFCSIRISRTRAEKKREQNRQHYRDAVSYFFHLLLLLYFFAPPFGA
jgi:hypothetical protein